MSVNTTTTDRAALAAQLGTSAALTWPQEQLDALTGPGDGIEQFLLRRQVIPKLSKELDLARARLNWLEAHPGQQIESLGIVTDCATDTELVISGVASLDRKLNDLLNFTLVGSKSVKDAVLKNFRHRLQIAYVTGLVDRRAYHEINNLGLIRNYYSHEATAPSFADPPIRSRCGQLSTYRRDRNYRAAFIRAIGKYAEYLDRRMVEMRAVKGGG